MSTRPFLLPAVWLCGAAAAAAACLGQEPAGVGVGLAREGDRIVILKVLPDTPAAASGGLHEGDRVLAVAEGDQPAAKVDGRGVAEVVKMLKGAKGSTVRLTVVPAGKAEADARVVAVVRGEVKQLWGDG